MKFEYAIKHAIQCIGQGISLKSEKKNMIQNFSAYTIKCVCHSIRPMFRVLGIYNFGGMEKAL